MGAIFLILTILFESLGIVMMKLGNGFSNKPFSIFGIALFLSSSFMLTMALKYLPMAWTNAVWAGTSTLLVAVIGYAFFQEKFTGLQMLCMLLIILGLIGLQIPTKA